MRSRILDFLADHKYEVLLVALVQHLYVGILLPDPHYYGRVIWPINMLVLGIAGIGIFLDQSKWKKRLKSILFYIVFVIPLTYPLLGHIETFSLVLSTVYCFYFTFLFVEIIRFLIRPSYVNVDIISACACGYLLLIEIQAFLFLIIYFVIPGSFSELETSAPGSLFIDMVYFSSITMTTIGFGDITPDTHQSRLLVSLFGVAAQFYSVVLIGILISKFSAER